MFRALYLKELREIWWISLPVLCAMLYGVSFELDFGQRTNGQGFGFLRHSEINEYHQPPLMNGDFAKLILMWGIGFAAIVGLWQTFRETQSRTWHFLLYRPVNRVVILRAKAFAAATLFTVVVVLPAIGVMLWCAMSGHHASPFRWSLTAPVWYAMAACPVVYFAALFAGLRRSHLMGSRWWPLISAGAAFGFLPAGLPNGLAIPIWAALLLMSALLMASVRDEILSADFS
jgi:ABC-type transport system involved in multi-copper enzyme maturation permease subunit